jgi:hypothetical protein
MSNSLSPISFLKPQKLSICSFGNYRSSENCNHWLFQSFVFEKMLLPSGSFKGIFQNKQHHNEATAQAIEQARNSPCECAR